MVLAIDRVSETVALAPRPSYTKSSFYSQLEISGHRRHKHEIKVSCALEPVRYADTLYLLVNNTRKRFLSRTYYQPRMHTKSYSDTTYANPKTCTETFVSYLHSYSDQLKRRFKTCIEIKPRPLKSSASFPNDTAMVSLQNGINSNSSMNGVSNSVASNDDVDENMNRRIPDFQEKYDPGASQVYIPKRKDFSGDERVEMLNSIGDQILINFSNHSNGELCNGYKNMNGHISDVSDF